MHQLPIIIYKALGICHRFDAIRTWSNNSKRYEQKERKSRYKKIFKVERWEIGASRMSIDCDAYLDFRSPDLNRCK